MGEIKFKISWRYANQQCRVKWIPFSSNDHFNLNKLMSFVVKSAKLYEIQRKFIGFNSQKYHQIGGFMLSFQVWTYFMLSDSLSLNMILQHFTDSLVVLFVFKIEMYLIHIWFITQKKKWKKFPICNKDDVFNLNIVLNRRRGVKSILLLQFIVFWVFLYNKKFRWKLIRVF